MHRLLCSAALLALTVGTLSAAPSAEAVTPPLKFGTFVFDPAGSDHANNAGYNRETIVIRNTTARAINVTGYRVRDVQNHVFVFPRGYVIGAGRSVILHSGSGTNTSTNVYWKQGYVWNNFPGDTAYLETPHRTRITACGYTAKAFPAGRRAC